MLAMKNYEALVQEYYKEPVDGVLEDVIASILERITIQRYELGRTVVNEKH